MWRTFSSGLRQVQATQSAALSRATLDEGCAWAPGLQAAAMQVRWKRGKRKKKPKTADRTTEQKAAAGGVQARLEDYNMEPCSPFAMSRTIGQHMRGLTSDGRHNARRKKDIATYTNHRVLRIAGLTHDDPEEEVDRRGFATPLTNMQDRAELPRSAAHRRFVFPHLMNYKVYWGPPSVQTEPNEYEGSMVACSVAMRLDDLPLTQRQKERLVDIVGPDRICEETGVVALNVDDFPERNHNAAMMGDMLEQLLREAVAVAPDEAAEE